MKIYYSNNHDNSKVSERDPVELDLVSAEKLLSVLRGSGSFMGVYLSEERALQFMVEQDRSIWLEILNMKSRTIKGCTVNLPLALRALRGAYSGNDVEALLAEFPLEWVTSSVDDASGRLPGN